MTDWEGPLAAGAAVAVAVIGYVSANWSTVHRHSATKQALEIRDQLEGGQREQWQRVIQRQLDAEERRGAGPAPSTVLLFAFVLSYISWVLFQVLVDANPLIAPLAPAALVLCVGTLVFGLAAIAVMAWQAARHWLALRSARGVPENE